MTLTDIKNWLQSQITNDCNFYIGRIDANKEKAVCVYPMEGNNAQSIAIGGLENTSYAYKPIRLLLRWGKNAQAAEIFASQVYNGMFGINGVVIGGKRVISFDMRTNEAIPMGVDDKGIYEYVIACNIIHER